MFIFRWVISTVLFLGVWIPFYILGFLFTWIGLLFCKRNSEHMAFPWWFWDSNAGINGTLEYQNPKWVRICNGNDNLTFDEVKQIVNSKTGKERTYKNRWIWVTWRNPVTNVSRKLIGIKERPYKETVNFKFGPITVTALSSGFFWSYSVTLSYGNGRGFFYRFGWKFDDVQHGVCCFMYRISPWKSI